MTISTTTPLTTTMSFARSGHAKTTLTPVDRLCRPLTRFVGGGGGFSGNNNRQKFYALKRRSSTVVLTKPMALMGRGARKPIERRRRRRNSKRETLGGTTTTTTVLSAHATGTAAVPTGPGATPTTTQRGRGVIAGRRRRVDRESEAAMRTWCSAAILRATPTTPAKEKGSIPPFCTSGWASRWRCLSRNF